MYIISQWILVNFRLQLWDMKHQKCDIIGTRWHPRYNCWFMNMYKAIKAHLTYRYTINLVGPIANELSYVGCTTL